MRPARPWRKAGGRAPREDAGQARAARASRGFGRPRHVRALFKREKEKSDAGKGKKRQKLLALLREASPTDRDLYLAHVGKKSVADLKTEKGYQEALATFAAELKKSIPDEPTRAEVLALFEFSGTNSGTHYVALKRLVAEAKFDKKKALSLLTKLTGDEYRQVRADQDLVTKLEAGLGSDKGAVKSLLGSTTAVVAEKDEDASARAKDDAELSPAHWAVIIKRELDKPELLLRQHGGQSLEKVALYFFQAQTAAERNHELAHVPVKVFMKEVITLLGPSRTSLEVQMPFLIPALESGERLSAADLRSMMVGTFQNYQEVTRRSSRPRAARSCSTTTRTSTSSSTRRRRSSRRPDRISKPS